MLYQVVTDNGHRQCKASRASTFKRSTENNGSLANKKKLQHAGTSGGLLEVSRAKTKNGGAPSFGDEDCPSFSKKDAHIGS